MILGYRLQDYRECGAKVPVCHTLSKKSNNLVITGKSGSGKSRAVLGYIWNIFSSDNGIVYISDYKGGEEYESFEGSPSYASGPDALQMINDFYEFFTEIRNRKIRLKRHYSLFIEEWSGLLSYAATQSAKTKTDLMGKVGEILAVGRGLNLGILLIVQRADASLFGNGSREQFQTVISFGRCSAEQFRMLGFSGELDVNPTQNYKAGQALVLMDGQDSIQEIIVPLVTNPEVMCQGIRKYLDRQPNIPSLVRAIAEGNHTGL